MRAWIAGLALLACLAGRAAPAEGTLRYRLDERWGGTGRARDELEKPAGLAVTDSRRVAVTDRERNTVVFFDRFGDWVRSVGFPKGESKLRFDAPMGIAVDRRDRIWIADTGNDRLVALDEDGKLLMTVGSRGLGSGRFRSPRDVACDSAGRIYVADTGNERIQVFTARGLPADRWDKNDLRAKGRIVKPTAVAFSEKGDGSLWVANEGSAALERFDLEGNWKETVDLERLLSEKVRVRSLRADASLDRLFVVDGEKNRVLVVGGLGQLAARVELPEGTVASAAVPHFNYDLLVADEAKAKVLIFDRE